MQAGPQRERVAVLGGGPAAIAAAFELTATAQLRERFEVTVFQPGWRLGGKCATGRNLANGKGARIEEHGLHIWFGFYENAFRAMRSAYQELNRPAGHPLATIEDAFKGCDEIVLYDRQDAGWQDFAFTLPPNEETPGGEHELPDFWEVAAHMCEWAVDRWGALASRPAQPGAAQPQRFTPGWFLDVTRALGMGVGIDAERGGEHLLYLARNLTRARSLLGAVPTPRVPLVRLPKRGLVRHVSPPHLLAALLTRFRDWMWEHVVRERCAQDEHLRLFFTIFDTFASATAGIVADGVLERGWDAINEHDLCEWLASHGAKEVTVGATPLQRSAILRSFYDLSFAYPEGLIANADVAAGAALNALLRIFFSYRGSVVYKMQAGMGETVLTPFYEVLKQRGVRFEFFHTVTDLHLSQDGRHVEVIEVVPQVELDRPYDPLVRVGGLDCWPSEPLWHQLPDGEQLKQRGVDFELAENPLERKPATLRRGADFDLVVLGIPVGALPPICTKIARRHKRFARMLESAATVRTQGLQFWLTQSTPELGWAHDQNSIASDYVEPLDTWCDMTHLLASEDWPAADHVRGLAYVCGVLEDRPDEDHAAATARVKRNAQAFLKRDLAPILPRAVTDGPGSPIRWPLLADGSARSGPARLAAQYWRANTTPSERYVLTRAKSVADRLGAHESGVANLVLAGDWTRNGIDGGCVEAAITSGMQAARALIGHSRRFPGESATWLTDRR